MDWHDGASWWWMAVAMGAVTAAVIAIVLVAVRSVTRSEPAVNARAELDARFARGDIDETEYRRRRAVLEEGRARR